MLFFFVNKGYGKNTNQFQNPTKPRFSESSGPILLETEVKSGGLDLAKWLLNAPFHVFKKNANYVSWNECA